MVNEKRKSSYPFPAQDYDYFFWKYRLTRFKSEVIYSGKDLIRFQKTHDKKKDGKPKKTGEKMFQQKKVFGVF